MCILIKKGSSNSFISASHKIAYYTIKNTLQAYGIENCTLNLTKNPNETHQCLKWKHSGN